MGNIYYYIFGRFWEQKKNPALCAGHWLALQAATPPPRKASPDTRYSGAVWTCRELSRFVGFWGGWSWMIHDPRNLDLHVTLKGVDPRQMACVKRFGWPMAKKSWYYFLVWSVGFISGRHKQTWQSKCSFLHLQWGNSFHNPPTCPALIDTCHWFWAVFHTAKVHPMCLEHTVNGDPPRWVTGFLGVTADFLARTPPKGSTNKKKPKMTRNKSKCTGKYTPSLAHRP